VDPNLWGKFRERFIDPSSSRYKSGFIWIEKMVTKDVVYELYSHAAVFVCPSIYEPFGIINLEAMACETAVVASAVGGIKEVVVDGETGYLVPLEQIQESPFEPVDSDKFSRDLAERINRLMADEKLQKKFGWSGRKRAVEKFSWATIAAETKKMYESLRS
jgi:glycosyltransferase involved in cell wall biosynthesis